MRALSLLLLSGCAAPLTIAAAGDLSLSAERRDDPLTPLSQILVGSLRFVNLEGPLTNAPSKQLRGRPEQAAWLEHRVDVVSIANNHADDAGPQGRTDTLAALRTHGILAVEDEGSFRNATILARSYAPDRSDDPALVDRVRMLSRKHFVIVSLHWGHTGSLLPSRDQRQFAAKLVDAGARVVLGHGPHSPQGVELRGNAVIAYSLGNLAFDCDCTNERDAYALTVRFEQGHLRSLSLQPLRAGLHDSPTRSDDHELRELLRQLSRDLGTQLDDRLHWPPTRGG